MMTTSGIGARVHRLRAFNRFYTRRIGALQQRVDGSGFNLTESRILWELADAAANDAAPCAAELGRRLGLDAGYMSRLLRSLESRKLVRTRPSPLDARQRLLSLTAGGRRAFAQLDERTQADMTGLLSELPAPNQARLLQAMQAIEGLLDTGNGSSQPPAAAPTTAPVRLRPPLAGDIGWVIERHGALYAQEFGWDWRFEALVARLSLIHI